MRFKKYLNESKFTLKVNKSKNAWIVFKDKNPISKKYTDKRQAIAKLKYLQRERDIAKAEREDNKITDSDYKAIAKEVQSLVKSNISFTRRDFKFKDKDKVARVLKKMEKEGILISDVHDTYDKVSISSGHFGGKTSLKRKRRAYRSR
jgi:hypothetical protein